jgi:hypothetical protein
MTTALVESVLMVAGLHSRLGFSKHPRQHCRTPNRRRAWHRRTDSRERLGARTPGGPAMTVVGYAASAPKIEI